MFQKILSAFTLLVAVIGWAAFIITKDRVFLDAVWFCIGGAIVMALWAIHDELRDNHR